MILYATCPKCGGQHMYHDERGDSKWFCWLCDSDHENDEIQWLAERSDREDYSLTIMKRGKRLSFFWYWYWGWPRVQFFKKMEGEWWGIIRCGFAGVNIYWEVPRNGGKNGSCGGYR